MHNLKFEGRMILTQGQGEKISLCNRYSNQTADP